MQNFDILCSEGLFLLSTPLRVSKQGIGSSVSLTLIIIDVEVVMGEFLSPADLFGAETSRIHELSKVVIVDKHEDFILRAF